MSYLIFDGVNDSASSASAVTRNLSNHRYTIKGIYRGDNSYFASMWNSRGFQLRGDRVRIYYAGSDTSNFTHTSNVLTSGDTFEYVITVTETSPGSGVNAHSVTLEINDSGSPVTCSGTLNVADANMQANAQIVLGKRGPDSVYCLVDIERFFYEDLDNAANNVDLDANLTNRTTGTPVLEDQVGSNDATGVNMPTDGSAWSDLSRPGIEITGQTPSFSYLSVSGVVDLAGEITVTGQTPNYTYSAINGVVEFTGEIIITGQTPDYTYTAQNGDIDLTPEITVTGQTPNYSYAAVNGVVELGQVINVVGQTPNYSYSSVSGDVVLAGEIVITGQTPNYTYQSINATVQLGELDFPVSFSGTIKSQAFIGLLKSQQFSGTTKAQAFNGIINQSSFNGVRK